MSSDSNVKKAKILSGDSHVETSKNKGVSIYLTTDVSCKKRVCNQSKEREGSNVKSELGPILGHKPLL